MLKVTVSNGGIVMTQCEVEFRKEQIARNVVAAKRERAALDKRKQDRATRYHKSH